MKVRSLFDISVGISTELLYAGGILLAGLLVCFIFSLLR